MKMLVLLFHDNVNNGLYSCFYSFVQYVVLLYVNKIQNVSM